MSRPVSLQDVMNEVSRGLDTESYRRPKPCAKSDFDILLGCDPLLSRLHKDHCDARANREQAEKDFGIGDDMTRLIADMEDSAWCAMQTRYLELRADRDLMQKIQAELKALRDEEERLERAEQEKEAMRFFNHVQMLIRLRQNRKEASDVLLWALVLLSLDNKRNAFQTYHPAYAFNRMAA